MDYPIPSHLKDYFKLTDTNNDEFKVCGNIECSCHHKYFKIKESNNKGIIILTCSQCQKDILLFDAGKHGWNGFVCHDDYINRSEPLTIFNCPKCNQSEEFSISIVISSQGKEDFLEECVANDDKFELKDWSNGFEWISADIACKNCHHKIADWLDYETM